MLTDLSDPALAHANELSLWAAYRSYARWPGGTLQDSPSLLRAFTGLNHPLFNGLFRTRLSPEDVALTVQEAVTVAQQRDLPFYWWVGPSDTPADLSARLEAAGLPYDGDVPGMSADLHAIPPAASLPIPTAATLERITTPAGIQASESVLQTCFRLPPDVAAGSLAGTLADFAAPDSHGWRYYLARVEDQPAAAGAILCADGVAGVHAVATHPDHRRKGLAAALVALGLRDARAAGYRIGALQSSDMAISVYERLGFGHVCTFRHHVHPAPLPNSALSA